jgi:hypothetical protein
MKSGDVLKVAELWVAWVEKTRMERRRPAGLTIRDQTHDGRGAS